MSVDKLFGGVQLEPISADPASPKQGQYQESDGTHRAAGLWRYDGSAWVQVGSGGGGLDVFLAEDHVATDSSDYSSGKNATFDGGGALGGALSDNDSTPINGERSIKYTTNATPGSSDNDYFYLPTITLDPKQKSEDVGLNLYYTWDGSDDLMEVVVWDDTNNALLTTDGEELVKAKSDPTRYSTSVYIPSSCNAIKVGFHHTGTSEASKVLEFTDVQLSTNPYAYKNLSNNTEWASHTPVANNFGTISNAVGISKRVGDSLHVREFFTSGTVAGSTASFEVPNGLAIDLNKLAEGTSFRNKVGTAIRTDSGQAHIHHLVHVDPADADVLYLSANPSASSAFDKDNASGAFNSGDSVVIEYIIPIEGWTETSEHVVTPSKTLKQYSEAAGDFTVTATSWTTNHAVLVPYRGSDGSWRLKGNINGTAASTTWGNISISGVTFATTYDQTVNCVQATGSVRGLFVDASGNTINRLGTYSASETWISFDIELDSKPTWADDIASNFLAAVPVPRVAIIEHREANNVAGGTYTSGSWQTRPMNEIKRDDGGYVSISSNEVTISRTGRYRLSYWGQMYSISANKCRVYDVTAAAATDILGSGVASGSTGQIQSMEGVVEVDGSNTFRIDVRGANTRATNGLGFATNFGEDEIYAQLVIEELK